MKYMNLSIEEINKLLKEQKVTKSDLVKESLNLSKIVNENYNAFVTIIDNPNTQIESNNILNGIPYGIKDLYSTKGILTTGSSNCLKDYIPPFNATVIEKLSEKGAIAINKTACDEFGMGGTGTTCHTGVVKNPWDRKRMCAGSSAGSACAVAAGVYPFALATDTGDSIRKPAAYCGVVGYKPTYGLLSRYGVLPFASSLDHLGVFTRNVRDAAIVINEIKGIDKKDMTTWNSDKIDLVEALTGNLKGKKLCYVKELCDINEYVNPSETLKKHLDNFIDKINMLKKNKVEVVEVSISKNLLNIIPTIYSIISSAEATSNMSNLTGFIFGPRGKGDNYIESIKNHRTSGFSPLIKRRFIIGSYVLQSKNQERYFKNAQRARRLIVDKFKDLFAEYDAVILPVSTGPAKYLSDANDTLSNDINILEEHLQIGNFGGFPSITIPDGFVDNLPVGLNITGNCYDDENVLNIAYSIESMMDYKNQIAKEVK